MEGEKGMKRSFVVATALAALALYATPAFAQRHDDSMEERLGESAVLRGRSWVLSPAKGITSATLYIDGVGMR